MAVTWYLVKFAVFWIMIMLFQGLAMKIAEPIGGLALVLTVLAIPPVALIEGLLCFVGFTRWTRGDDQ